jgi:hypothetical protein
MEQVGSGVIHNNPGKRIFNMQFVRRYGYV